VVAKLLNVATERTPLVRRCAESHPGRVGATRCPNPLDDHVVVCRRHCAATVRDHHDAIDVEQMDTYDAASQRRGRHSTARGADDLGVTDGQPNHLQGHDSRVHAGDDQDTGIGNPVEPMKIKALGKPLVVGQ